MLSTQETEKPQVALKLTDNILIFNSLMVGPVGLEPTTKGL